jgi:hypothetical protein
MAMPSVVAAFHLNLGGRGFAAGITHSNDDSEFSGKSFNETSRSSPTACPCFDVRSAWHTTPWEGLARAN